MLCALFRLTILSSYCTLSYILLREKKKRALRTGMDEETEDSFVSVDLDLCIQTLKRRACVRREQRMSTTKSCTPARLVRPKSAVL